MKILMDECLPLDFRHSISGHVVHTVQWAGLKGKQNGELLRAAELANYDVLVTVDQGIPFQQSIVNRNLSIVVVRSRTNQIEDLLAAGGIDLACTGDDPARRDRCGSHA